MAPIMPPLPIDRFLTPERSLVVPAGFERSRQDLTRGVPFEFPLEAALGLILVVPTGTAITWRDADPASVVSASDDETQPHQPPRGADPHQSVPIRLLVRQARRTLATVPLAAGLLRLTPDGDHAPTVIELLILRWLLHAGCMRGPGDFGSFIDVAWRRAGQGANAFLLAPLDQHVAARHPELVSAAIGLGADAKPRGGYLP